MNKTRVANCLLGCALGDSLGLPKEGLRADRAEKILGRELRQCLAPGIGSLSDDTQQSLFAYLAATRYPNDPESAAAEFGRLLKRWFFTVPPGVGLATVKACLRLAVGVKAGRSGVHSAGNGAAMRAPVIGCLFADCAERRKAHVEAISRVTHTHPLAVQGAQIVAHAAACFAQNKQKAFWQEFEADYPDWPQDMGVKGNPSGYVVHSVNTVLDVIRERPADLLRAIDLAISKGGDTDTIAAMVGAIVGAGREQVSVDDRLLNWIGWPSANQIRAIDELCKNRVPFGNIALGNALTLPFVLLHGFRRIFPPY